MKIFLTFTVAAVISSGVFAAEEIVNVEKPTAVTAAIGNTEEQIPLNIDVVKKATDTAPTSNRMLLTGIILMGMLGAAYYLVRKYKTSNTINKSNMQIKVLSQHYLGPKKSLAIIHVAGESMLIGITDSNISMMKSLSLIDDEIPASVPKSFAETLIKNTNKSAAGASSLAASEMNNELGDSELEEEFSFSGLKDSVSKKLKSMRSI